MSEKDGFDLIVERANRRLGWVARDCNRMATLAIKRSDEAFDMLIADLHQGREFSRGGIADGAVTTGKIPSFFLWRLDSLNGVVQAEGSIR